MKYVWAAYSIVWIFIFGYTLFLSSRQKVLDREIMLLKQALQENNGQKQS